MKWGVALVFVFGLMAAACAGSDATPGDVSITTSAGVTSTTPAEPATTTATTIEASEPPSTSAATTTTTSAAPRFIQAPAFDSWAAVLASLPVDDHDRADAEAYATELRVPGIGVALSDDYPSLNPGYWVVFTEPGDDAFEADWACYQLQERIPDCYRRYFGVDPAQRYNRKTGHLLALDGAHGVFRVVDYGTGEVVRTIGGFGGDGRYPGEPQLDVARWSAYYSVGVEDYWFSCESSDGTIMRLDLETGRDDKVADGTSPVLSADVRRLAYLAASDCYPDPLEPQFVLAPFDTIVERNLETGAEIRRIVPLTTDADGYPVELTGVVWGSDDTELYVLDLAGQVRRFAIGDAEGDLVAELDGHGHWWRLLGFDNDAKRLLIQQEAWLEGEESNRFLWLDPATGTVELVLEVAGHATAAFDARGNVVGIAVGSTLIIDGEELPLDVDVVFFDW